MPERGSFRGGATISRGPSIGASRVGGGERGFSSVISGSPRVSITRSIGATRVPGVEGRLGVPLRPISLPGISGERQTSSFNRNRLTNISISPASPRANGGEFKATTPPQARRLPQMRPIGEIGHLIEQTGGMARNTNVSALGRQSEPVLVPGRGISGPELRANTVRIVPFRNNRAFDRGSSIQAPRTLEIGNRPPQRVENTPPITTGRVLGPEVSRTEPVTADRNIPDRKRRTSRTIRRIREQLRRQSVLEMQSTSDNRETARVRSVAFLETELAAKTQEVPTLGSKAKNKLLSKLVKREDNRRVSADDQTAEKEVKENSVRMSLKQRLNNSKRAFSLAVTRVRSGVAIDLDELLRRKKKKAAVQAHDGISKKPTEQAAVQSDHLVAEVLDTIVRLDMQPTAAPARQPLAHPETTVIAATDTITTAAAVQSLPNAQVAEQKSAVPGVLAQQKPAAQPENKSKPKNKPSQEPEQAKGNYIISRPTQNHRVNAGRNGIWLSFAGTAQEKIEAEAILEQVQRPSLQTTSPVLIALGAGQAVESGIADPTDQAWREDFAKSGEVTQRQAEEILVYVIDRHKAIARGKGNPRASKEQVEAVLGNVPREDEMANLPS